MGQKDLKYEYVTVNVRKEIHTAIKQIVGPMKITEWCNDKLKQALDTEVKGNPFLKKIAYNPIEKSMVLQEVGATKFFAMDTSSKQGKLHVHCISDDSISCVHVGFVYAQPELKDMLEPFKKTEKGKSPI